MPEESATPAREIRFDRGELLRARQRADGTLLLEGVAAKTGIYEYQNADGSIRRERVTRKVLMDSMASLARCVLTLEHPPEFVTPDNVQKYSIGDVDGSVAYDEIEGEGGFVKIRVAVRRRDAIDGVNVARRDNAPVEFSPGYYATVDHTPGEDPDLGHYDADQIARSYNHQALLLDGRARGGPECSVRVDGVDVPVAYQVKPPTEDARSMNAHLLALAALVGIKTDGVTDEAALAIQISDSVKGLQTSAGTVASLQAQVDGFLAADKARTDKAEREQLDALAKDLGIEVKPEQKNDELKTAIAKHELGDALPSSASSDFLNGIVLAARARVDAGPGANPWADFTPRPKTDAERADADKAPLDLDGLVRKQISDARNGKASA